MQEKLDIHIEIQPRITMVIARSLQNKPGIAAELFSHLGAAGFNIEMITQSAVSEKLADISFALGQDDAKRVIEHLKTLASLAAREFTTVEGKGILTVFGHGFVRAPGLAGRLFSLLANEGINIEMISTSLSSISVLIKEDLLERARIVLTEELNKDA